jgi:hypothetical protein
VLLRVLHKEKRRVSKNAGPETIEQKKGAGGGGTRATTYLGQRAHEATKPPARAPAFDAHILTIHYWHVVHPRPSNTTATATDHPYRGGVVLVTKRPHRCQLAVVECIIQGAMHLVVTTVH